MGYILCSVQHKTFLPGVDPGFPVGGVNPFWGGGGVDLRRGHFSVKMYVKTKELGPVGGGGSVRRKIFYVDPPMFAAYNTIRFSSLSSSKIG